MLRAMCCGMIGQEPSHVAFLSIAKSLKGCWSGGDDDQYRLRGGSQAPLLAAAHKLGSALRLNAAVRAVRPLSDGEHGGAARYQVATDESRVHARSVVVTGSPAALLGIDLPLAAADAQLLQRMPMGESCKLFVCTAGLEPAGMKRWAETGGAQTAAGMKPVLMEPTVKQPRG